VTVYGITRFFSGSNRKDFPRLVPIREAGFLGPALAIALVLIGLTVRIALMHQPGTRFQFYLRLVKDIIR
jgi:hypothetical protein